MKLGRSSFGLITCILFFASFYGNYLGVVPKDFFSRFQQESEALVVGRIVADDHGLIMPSRSNLGFASIGQFAYEPRYLTQGYSLIKQTQIADKQLSTTSFSEDGWIQGVRIEDNALMVAYDDTLDHYIGRQLIMTDGKSRVVQSVTHAHPNTKIYTHGNPISETIISSNSELRFAISGAPANSNEISLHPYASQFGIQGSVFSWIFQLFDEGLTTAYILTAAFLSAILTWLCFVYAKLIGNRFALAFFIVTCLSPWLVSFARNLYWIPFSWFLPAAIAASIPFIRTTRFQVIFWLGLYASFVFKCLAGYEFISSIILLAGAPFLYNAISTNDHANRISNVKIFSAIQFIGVAGFITALLFHAHLRGDTIWSGLIQIYEADVKRRTYATPSAFGENLAASLSATPLDVINIYLFDWKTQVITGIAGKAFFWLSLFAVLIASYRLIIFGNRRDFALLVAFILPPLSWFVLAKAHSHVHVHMNFVLWYFGFIPAIFLITLEAIEKQTIKLLHFSNVEKNTNQPFSFFGNIFTKDRTEYTQSSTVSNMGRSKLAPLTAMRFFAASMIVIGHAHPLFGSYGIATTIPLNQGVSFFFVLSGFILTYNYPALSNTTEFRKFWVSRIARIWPLHIVMCAIWIALVFNFDQKTHFPGADGIIRLIANLFLLQIWVPLHSWVLSFNGVSWSIAVELFFYACFPLLISNWRTKWPTLIAAQLLLVLIAIFAGAYWQLPSEPGQNFGLANILYFNPLVRLFEFTIGIVTALSVARMIENPLKIHPSGWLILELFSIFAASVSLLAVVDLPRVREVLGASFGYYLSNQGGAFFFAIMIGIFSISKGPIAHLLSTRVLVFLGEISFALYLSHAIVIHYLNPYSDRLNATGDIGYAVFWFTLLVISAALFWGIERPARSYIIQRFYRHATETNVAIRNTNERSAPLVITSQIALSTIVLLALFLKPTAIQSLSDTDIDLFFTSPSAVRLDQGASFNGSYTVLGYRSQPFREGRTRIEIVLRTERDVVIREKLALHLNNEKGEIIGQPGDMLMDPARGRIAAGTQWTQTFLVNSEHLHNSKSIALAIYENPTELFSVSGGVTDWGGKRLILNQRFQPMH